MTEDIKQVIVKRSLGVTTVATLIILLSVARLLGTGSIGAGFSFLPKSILMIIISYSILSNIGSVVAAVNIYRLKEWARKAIIILVAVQIIYMFFVSIPLSSKSIEELRTAPESKEQLLDGFYTIPEEVRAEKNITEEGYITLVFQRIYLFLNIARVVSIVYLLLIIFFFTRPEVKKQFMRSNQQD